MSRHIARKPVPGEADPTYAKPSPITQNGTGTMSDHKAPLTPAELDENVQDMGYLAPLVSRLDIGDSAGVDDSGNGAPAANESSSLRSRVGKVFKAPLSSSNSKAPGRASLDKPLPEPPLGEIGQDGPLSNLPAHPGVRPSIKPQARSERPLQRDVKTAADLDLQDSEDTTVRTKWAPAITHETVTQNVHEHQTESITREIHEHHVFHRILPIVDIEVLPARHYVQTHKGIQEVPKDRVPGRASSIAGASVDAQRLLASSLKKAMPKDESAPGPRQFTARDFPGTEGDYKESTSPSGAVQTERHWVHPPTLEEGARKTGQTRPLYLQ